MRWEWILNLGLSHAFHLNYNEQLLIGIAQANWQYLKHSGNFSCLVAWQADGLIFALLQLKLHHKFEKSIK